MLPNNHNKPVVGVNIVSPTQYNTHIIQGLKSEKEIYDYSNQVEFIR